jgi:cysteinyl-tRNA synthetase
MTSPREFVVYNTWTRSLEALKPLKPGHIGIYCCGPTVYDYQHIGNFKTFLFEDVLVRALRFAGYSVNHVMNITDVGHLVGDGDEGEDKMAVAMRRERKKSEEIAEYYTRIFFEDWDKLGLRRPDVVCNATQHIKEMIDLISKMEAKGFTYTSGGNVYFDTSKSANYGFLARLNLEKLKAGARVAVDDNKRNPSDFVLWFTKSKFENQELQWDSPWGRGYPGWHIECSAMSIKYLGEEFDIHCGGIDHIPVHHTNEIAQSEACTGKPWVKVWMHSEFIMVNAEKMSKSKGKFIILDDVLERGLDPLVYRFLCLNSHYRAQLNFTWEILENAKNGFERLKNSVLALKASLGSSSLPAISSETARQLLERFTSAICDDLKMPLSMSVVWEAVSEKNLSDGEKLSLLLTFDQVLGFGMEKWQAASSEVPAEIQALLTEREAARKNKDFKLSDELRDKISELGYLVKDGAQGQKVTKR